MVGYIDTSVLLRHILLGDSSIKQVLEAEYIISSELLEIESRRVIHRYRIDGELNDDGFLEANKRLNEVLSGISMLALSPAVKKRAMGAFPGNLHPSIESISFGIILRCSGERFTAVRRKATYRCSSSPKAWRK